MTDPTNTAVEPSKFLQSAKTIGSAGVFMEISQHITPMIVGYFCAKYPLFPEGIWFEIVTGGLSVIGAAVIYVVHNGVVQTIVNVILWSKNAKSKIQQALTKQENV